MAARTIKTCDLSGRTAAQILEILNPGKVSVVTLRGEFYSCKIITDVEPKDLTYPEGWYYAKGTFRNKHQSTTGIYSEVPMLKTDLTPWTANYCTLY